MQKIAENKKAWHEYEVLEKFEAGMVLTGPEIKAIRDHRVQLSGAFCRVQNGELFALNIHISNTLEPERTRKLLVHKSELHTLIGKTQQKGLSIIPLNLYIKKGHAKLEIALARGKKIYSHRDELRKKDIDRQAERELRE
jgi:SsrA-binding protein